jgi:hypothetical protein
MPYCNGKPKAKIKFKYAGDADWTILNSNHPPVDYAVNPGNNYLWVLRASTYDAAIAYPCNNPGWIRHPNAPSLIVPACNGARIPVLEYVYAGYYAKSLSSITLEAANAISLSSAPVVAPPYGDYRNYCKCNFTVTDISGLIYSLARSTCPQVEVNCDSCPPQTVCECDCGTEVCCYDAAGTPIFYYSK